MSRRNSRQAHKRFSQQQVHLEFLEGRRLLAAHIVGSSASYATIQAAVNAAATGAVITVDAGNYAEMVTVNKSLTIRGAQAGVNATTRSGTESDITGALQSSGVSAAFYITASDVTIDGFTVEGESNQSVTMGAGIVMAAGVSGTHILNNIVDNNVAGVFLANSSSTDPAIFRQNLFENNNFNGENGGRGIYSDSGITGGKLTNVLIDSNTFYNNYGSAGTTGAEAGISLEATTSGAQTNIQITNNTFNHNGKAVLLFCTTNALIQGNTVTGQTDSAGSLRFEGGDVNIQILDNDIFFNSGAGIATDSKAVGLANSGFVIERNDLVNNSSFWHDNLSVIVEADDYTGTMNVTDNWWGDASGPGGQGPGTGDKIYGDGYHISGAQWAEEVGSEVTFSGWATTPFTWAIPTAPATLSGTASVSGTTAQIALTWPAATGTPIRYELERSTDGVNFSTVAVLAPTVLSYTDTGLTPGVNYTYRIGAETLAGSSAYTVSAPVGTAPIPVTNLSSLNWTSATTGYGTIQKNASINGNTLTLNGVSYATGIGTHAYSTIVYNLAGLYKTFNATVGVDQEEDGKGTGSVDFKVVGDGTTLFDSGVLTNDHAKSLSVSVANVKTLTLIAANGVTNSIDYDHSDWAGAVLIGATPVAPTAPTKLTATAVSSSSIKLSWTAGSANLTSYTVQRSTDGSHFTTIAANVDPTATTYTDSSSLAANTTYYYLIQAVNSVGSSPNSNIASTATLPIQTVTYLSDLNWTSATAGWGTVQKDKSIKGNTLSLNGTTYAKGIGTHAASTIVYNLAGKYKSFLSDVGVDDEENGVGLGSVDFKVIADGKTIFDSGVLHNGNAAVSLNVSVVGVKTLQLVATNGIANDIDYDHSDWAGARLLS